MPSGNKQRLRWGEYLSVRGRKWSLRKNSRKLLKFVIWTINDFKKISFKHAAKPTPDSFILDTTLAKTKTRRIQTPAGLGGTEGFNFNLSIFCRSRVQMKAHLSAEKASNKAIWLIVFCSFRGFLFRRHRQKKKSARFDVNEDSCDRYKKRMKNLFRGSSANRRENIFNFPNFPSTCCSTSPAQPSNKKTLL